KGMAMKRLLILACLAGAFLAAPFSAGQGIKQRAEETTRVDAYGDPLPAGALARFGTTRLREGGEAHIGRTPDGERLPSLGSDGFFHAWSTSDGREIRRFSKPGPPSHASYQDLAMLRIPNNNVLRLLWQAQLRGGEATPSLTSAFSPDGKILATFDTRDL